MLIGYHESITCRALSAHFSPPSLEVILVANIKQDDLLTGQIGHDEYHYDNNAIAESDNYLKEQRVLTINAIQNNNLHTAWAAFGRLIHTAQDFYAHSNYVDLWLAHADGQTPPPPSEIAPVMDDLVHSPDLRSGKLYYPFGVLSFVPFVKRFIIPLLPKDSHAHMHLDSTERGVRFEYAFEAAVKRTVVELESTKVELSSEQQAVFYGK